MAGFSLTELMVALAIIAVLAAIGVPNFMADMPRRRLAKAARDLVTDLQWTRLQAISTNRQWRISFQGYLTPADPSDDFYQIEDSGDNNFGTAPNPVIRTTNLSEYGSGIQYGWGAATLTWSGEALVQAAAVTFDARGLCGMGSSFLTNQDNSLAYAITTSPAGGLRVRKYNGILPFNTNNWVEK